ncbi:MAG: M13 family metallopeptidase [Clostridiales bacterium]|nr:M13 family metallopeptidase [Clostridiales bacterium]
MSKENTAVRVQDDLYQFVNGEWLKTAVIPGDRPMTGGFSTLDEDVEKLLMKDFAGFANGAELPDVPIMEDAVRLYKKALDEKARGEAGMKPLYPLLREIKGIKTVAEFNEKSFELLRAGVTFPYELAVMEDWKDTSRYGLAIMDPGLILPDTSYYEKTVMKLYMLSLYKKMAKSMLKYTELSPLEQRQYLKDTIAFDDMLRKKALSAREMADYYKLYNPMPAEEVYALSADLDLKGLLEKLYGDGAPKIIGPANPRFMQAFKDIFNEKNFTLFIHWCYVNTVFDFAQLLSPEIYAISRQYANKLMGIKEMPPIEKQAYMFVSETFDKPIGVYYGRKYFGEEAKADITSIVKKIIETYEERIRKNGFLAEETKEKAILKLSSIKIKMGYPDNYEAIYDTFKVDEDASFFDAASSIRLKMRMHQFEKLNKPTDRSEWQMPGHMVNACYDPFKNDITFPAAILQKPFYSVDQKIEENLGGIGAVIGHEISHAFDNNGAHFDENGNLFDWWKEDDFKTFEELTKGMTEQFDGIPFHGGKVNGGLVVSENIADAGGMAVTIEIMHKLPDPDFKAYFLNWGRIWCMKAKEGFIKLLLTMDVHSPSELRANMMPRNFKEWYDAFDVKPTDKMYLPEDKRVVIW